MSDENYGFNIIHEAAAPNDQFPDKTHKKIATTLYDLIQSSPDRGVTIGLEGGWGSGKSTVVNLLRKQLADQDNGTLFFLFDAWAHEGDPLRRIFLESLIYEIDPEGKDKELSTLQKEISGRKKTVKIKTTKSTSKLGSFLSLSAILVPVGAAILSAVDYSNISMPSLTGEPYWAFILGLLLALAPFLPLGLWSIFGEKDKGGFLGKRWDVFASDTKENYTQDITESGERTSIEFERFFGQIMDHSIGDGKKYRQALIVVDNLDRIEPEQTLAIWSILQTFFQHRSNSCSLGEESWISKLWFLVPYDREGLSLVWSKNNQPSEANKTKNSPENFNELTQSQTIQSENLALSFLEKCFQIIAEVPEPVMSAWVEYSENTIRGALFGWPEEKREEIISTHKRFESRLESSPTPRQIHAFTNRVGMLGMRWHDKMSAEAIALYALARKNCSDRQLRKTLLAEGLPDGYEGTTDSYELKKQLAGILFGVNKDKGMQLLLEPEIRSALNSGDPENLRSLVETHGEAFWVAWEAIKESNLPNGHTEDYRIAVTKAFCGGVSNHKARVASDINRLISEWKRCEDKWALDKYDYSDALTALLNMVGSKNTLGKLLDWLQTIVNKSTINATALVGEKEFKPSTLSNISKLVTLLGKNGRAFQRAHYSKLDHSKWGLWLDCLNSEEIEIKFVLPAKGVIKNLAGTISNNNPDINSLQILNSTLYYLPISKEWKDVAVQLTAFANNQNHTPGIDAAYKLMSNMYCSCIDSVKEEVETCIMAPQFSVAAQKEAVDTVPSLLVLCALVAKNKLIGSGISQNVKAFWQAEFDQEKCRPVIDLLKEQERLSIVWHLAREKENMVAIGIIKNDIDEAIYISSLGVEYIDEYSWASEDELGKIISKSAIAGGLSEAKDDLIKLPVPYRRCLKLIRQYGGTEGVQIVEEALKNTPASSWIEALSEDMILFDCIDKRGDHEFKKGIQKLLLEELEKGELSAHIWERFSDIYSKMMDKEDVAETIVKKYFDLESDPLSDQAFEQLSSCVSGLISKINSAALMGRVELWLVGSQWSRISFLLSADFNFEGEPKEALASRVITLLNDDDEEHQDILQLIAKTFNIQIEEESEKTDGD